MLPKDDGLWVEEDKIDEAVILWAGSAVGVDFAPFILLRVAMTALWLAL